MLILPFWGLILTFWTLMLTFYGHGERDVGEISSPCALSVLPSITQTLSESKYGSK